MNGSFYLLCKEGISMNSLIPDGEITIRQTVQGHRVHLIFIATDEPNIVEELQQMLLGAYADRQAVPV